MPDLRPAPDDHRRLARRCRARRRRRQRTTTSAAAPAPSCASSTRRSRPDPTHTLRVAYTLGTPQASDGGQLPAGDDAGAPGPRLRFNFGFTDLGPGRYLEAWIPANLIFDQFDARPRAANRSTPRSPTRRSPTARSPRSAQSLVGRVPGALHRAVAAARAARRPTRVTSQTGTVDAPGLGHDRDDRGLEADEQRGRPRRAQITNIASCLAANETSDRPVRSRRPVRRVLQRRRHGVRGRHDDSASARCGTRRSTAGGAAASSRPARPTAGGTRRGPSTTTTAPADRLPFDFTDPPVELCSRNPWARVTPARRTRAANALFEGVAVADRRRQPAHRTCATSTLAPRRGRRRRATSKRSSWRARAMPPLVDAFHRFVYGFADPRPAPDLWIKDDPGHAGRDAGPARSGIRPTSGSATPTTAGRRISRRSPARTTGSTPACATAARRGRARTSS